MQMRTLVSTLGLGLANKSEASWDVLPSAPFVSQGRALTSVSHRTQTASTWPSSWATPSNSLYHLFHFHWEHGVYTLCILEFEADVYL